MIAFGVSVVTGTFVICRPISRLWNHLQPGACGNMVDFLVAISGCNAATDLIIIILPMPLVWRLQMATRKKIELTFIFALGFM